MKLISCYVGLLLVGLCMSIKVTDNSLPIRNKQYLPPPIQELPINDDYYNTQESTQQQQQQQQQQEEQKFEEKKYANSKYQIFEVHNHYEPPSGNGESIKESSSQTSEEIRIEHINAPADFPLDDPSLDASYLGFATGNDDSNQQIIVKHESKNVEGTSNNIPVPFPSNYRHTFPEKSNKQQNYNSVQQFKGPNYLPPQRTTTQQYPRQPVQNSLTTSAQTYQNGHNSGSKSGKEYLPPIPQKSAVGGPAQAPFKGPDYLPPQKRNNNDVAHYKGPDYLPPRPQGYQQSQQNFNNRQQNSAQAQQNFGPNSQFKGPDYLPPQQHGSTPAQQNFVTNSADYLPPQHQGSAQSQQNYQHNTHFKGPDYLPPSQKGSAQSEQPYTPNNPFKGPDYLPPSQKGSSQSEHPYTANNAFKGPDYLPPAQQQTHSQQTTFRPSIPYNEPEYVPLQQTAFKGPDYLPPYQGNSVQQQFRPSTTFKGADYLPPQHHVSGKSQQINLNQNTGFKGPDYLPPKQQQQHNSQFKGPDYLPPQQQQQNHNNFQPNNPFKGPDYLPPYQNKNEGNFKGPDYLPPQGNQVQELEQQVQNLPSGYDFQKPPNSEQAIAELHTLPEQSPQYQEVTVKSQIQVAGREQGPDIVYGTSKHANPPQNKGYLPPGYDFPKPENSEQTINQLHNQEPITDRQPFKAVDYLPPGYDFQKPANSEQAINQLHSSDPALQPTSRSATEDEGYSAPSYLPPGYDFQKPANAEQAINELHSLQNSYQSTQTQVYNQQQQSHSQVTQFRQNYQTQAYHGTHQQSYSQGQGQQAKASEYLPPTNSVQQIDQPSVQPFKGPDYLPPSSGSQNFKGPDYLPPSSGSQNFKGPDYLPPTTGSQNFKGPDFLPPTTGSQNFKGPDYLPPNTGSPNFKGPDYLPPTPGAQNFKGPDYLPPVASSQTAVAQNNQYSSQTFKGPDYLPPVNVKQSYQGHQQTQFKAPDYLPPTPQAFIQSTMYPLSSYMTNVKPHDRYANSRRPFPEYGLPPSKTVVSNDLSPMYREPASRPQYYAPTMSYTTNAFNSQTYTTFAQNQYQNAPALSQQAREALQTFMPEDIRQKTAPIRYNAPTAVTAPTTNVQTTKSATAKIRTVQIVNPNAVKTLKVLESLDHTGVKTIKILGPSHEEPMGDHRVVKVVSGGHEQNVQTVKIFNDHQDVSANANVGQTQGNSYLPPRRKRNPNSKPKSSKGHRHK
ncbi:LOW QUALITY PROTEIN: adhesive plaque matrix protein [Lucilia cuprina]|uniref:LOW QUALITY PROTEIN: adhesive plaque matrix protein n=1 Tax=Lucilia cuprina TaxID=7375 RepID=UPI001F0670F2|nr:LOW QUALITY PROTEIN: adhesive plaque matrix protein [Lucilia cuprina]